MNGQELKHDHTPGPTDINVDRTDHHHMPRMGERNYIGSSYETLTEDDPRFMVKTSETSWLSNDGNIKVIFVRLESPLLGRHFESFWLEGDRWRYADFCTVSPSKVRRSAEKQWDAKLA